MSGARLWGAEVGARDVAVDGPAAACCRGCECLDWTSAFHSSLKDSSSGLGSAELIIEKWGRGMVSLGKRG